MEIADLIKGVEKPVACTRGLRLQLCYYSSALLSHCTWRMRTLAMVDWQTSMHGIGMNLPVSYTHLTLPTIYSV